MVRLPPRQPVAADSGPRRAKENGDFSVVVRCAAHRRVLKNLCDVRCARWTHPRPCLRLTTSEFLGRRPEPDAGWSRAHIIYQQATIVLPGPGNLTQGRAGPACITRLKSSGRVRGRRGPRNASLRPAAHQGTAEKMLLDFSLRLALPASAS